MATREVEFNGKAFLIDDETGKVFFKESGTEVTVASSVATVMKANPPPAQEATVASGLSQRALSNIVGPSVAAAAQRDNAKIIALKKLYQFGSKPTWAGGEKPGWFGVGFPEKWDASEDPRFARYKGRLQTADNIAESIRLFSDMVNDTNPAISAFGMDRLDKLTTIISRGGSETPGVMGVSTGSGAGGSVIGHKEWWTSPGGMHISLTPEKGSLQHRAAEAQHGVTGAAKLVEEKKKAQEDYDNYTEEQLVVE